MKSGEGKYQIRLTAEPLFDSGEPREAAAAAELGQEGGERDLDVS